MTVDHQYKNNHRHLSDGVHHSKNTQNRDNLALNLKLEALMMKLKITNSKLYGADDFETKELACQTKVLRAITEDEKPNDI